MTMLGVVPEWIRLLFLPAHLQIDYMPQEIERADRLDWPQLLGALLALLLTLGAIRARRREPVLAFAACWVAVTLFPVSNLAIATGLTLAERTLFLPSVGAVLAVGTGVSWLERQRVNLSVRLRRTAVMAGGLVIGLAAAKSAARQPVWRNNESVVDQMLVDSPRSYRSHWWRGRRLHLARDFVGAEREFRLAIELFPSDARLLADLADRYVVWDRCEDAVPLYRRSLALDPQRPWLQGRLIRCLALLGRFEEARQAGTALAGREPAAKRYLELVDSLARLGAPACRDEGDSASGPAGGANSTCRVIVE
jgi:tetratricopeptide (TPR) repeat protein